MDSNTRDRIDKRLGRRGGDAHRDPNPGIRGCSADLPAFMAAARLACSVPTKTEWTIELLGLRLRRIQVGRAILDRNGDRSRAERLSDSLRHVNACRCR